MLGKLSKADGRVSSEEIRVVEQLMDRNLKLSPKRENLQLISSIKPKIRMISFETMHFNFMRSFVTLKKRSFS